MAFLPPPPAPVDEDDKDCNVEEGPPPSCSELDSGEDCKVVVATPPPPPVDDEEWTAICGGEKIGRSDDPFGRDGEKNAACVMSLILPELDSAIPCIGEGIEALGGEFGAERATPDEDEEEEEEEDDEEEDEDGRAWKSELLGEFELGEFPPPLLIVFMKDPILPPLPPLLIEFLIVFATHSTNNLVLSVVLLMAAISSKARCWLDKRDWIWALCAWTS